MNIYEVGSIVSYTETKRLPQFKLVNQVLKGDKSIYFSRTISLLNNILLQLGEKNFQSNITTCLGTPSIKYLFMIAEITCIY